METTQIAVSTNGREQAQKTLTEAAANLPGARTVTTATGGIRVSFRPSGSRPAPKPVEPPAMNSTPVEPPSAAEPAPSDPAVGGGAEPAQGKAEGQAAPAQRQHPPLTESRVAGLLHAFVKQEMKNGTNRETALSKACARLMKIIARTELTDAERGARFQQVSTALTEWKAFWAEYDARRPKPAGTEQRTHEEPKGVSFDALGDGLASIGQITLVPPACREECLDDSVPASPDIASASQATVEKKETESRPAQVKAAPSKTGKRRHTSLAAPGRVKELIEGAVRRNRENGKGKDDVERRRLACRWVMDLVVHDEELTREERVKLIAEIRAEMPHQPLTLERVRELIERRIKRLESEGANSDEAAKKAAGGVWHLVESDETLSAEAKQKLIAKAKSYLPKPEAKPESKPAEKPTRKHSSLTGDGRVETLMQRFTDEESVETATNRVLAIVHREVCDGERGRVFDRVKNWLQTFFMAPLREEGGTIEEIETASNQAVKVFEEAMKKLEPKLPKPRRQQPQGQRPAAVRPEGPPPVTRESSPLKVAENSASLAAQFNQLSQLADRRGTELDIAEPGEIEAAQSGLTATMAEMRLVRQLMATKAEAKKAERIQRQEAQAKKRDGANYGACSSTAPSKKKNDEGKKGEKGKKGDKKAERAAAQA